MTKQLLSAADEMFFIEDTSNLTSPTKVNDLFGEVAKRLLEHYVKAQGHVLSQMLRKSVETRDWLNTVEPRAPRAVMKRVVEEITLVDRQAGALFEEGQRQARSSDSSRRTRPSASVARSWSAAANAAAGGGSGGKPLDASLASNIQRMFVERIDVFGPVEFSRVAIVTGVVKIALKTLQECVRLRTFSRFGFQQVQVDTHYLNLYLWRFVSDEALVAHMLDEVMSSAVHRCAEPSGMEQSIVDTICERA
jgi:hypothetical protein